jgi:xylulokinase
MDSSTGQQCAALEQALGGAQAVATLTGSRAYERFTGNQIARIHQTQPEAYASAECIALVSSFIATLFAGSFVPIDVSDGSGMNLMDIRTKQWSQAALDATAPGLKLKLGPLVPSHTVAGRIHKYFAERFGFSPDCLVVAASGDNPNSLAGLRLQHTGDIALSLGTSDTLFGSVAEPAPSASEGHIFVNPVDPDAYMAMVCIKNGSLTRESVRNESAAGSWEQFQRMLQETRPGNDGNIGFYIREPEITPPILQTGVHRFDGQGRRVAAFASAVECRAVVEGQFMSMRLHGGNIGIRPRSVLATGGASANAAIVKVIADVFGVPVFVGEQPNSAALGAAYRALHGWTCHRRRAFVSFAEVLQGAPPFKKAFDPDAQSHAVYTKMLERYAASEQSV